MTASVGKVPLRLRITQSLYLTANKNSYIRKTEVRAGSLSDLALNWVLGFQSKQARIDFLLHSEGQDAKIVAAGLKVQAEAGARVDWRARYALPTSQPVHELMGHCARPVVLHVVVPAEQVAAPEHSSDSSLVVGCLNNYPNGIIWADKRAINALSVVQQPMFFGAIVATKDFSSLLEPGQTGIN